MHPIPTRQRMRRQPIELAIPPDLLEQLHSRHPFCDLRSVLQRTRTLRSHSDGRWGQIKPSHWGQLRPANSWVVVACLGYSRAGAAAVIFTKKTPDLLFGIRRCLWSLGALPQTLVWDRQSGLHAYEGRPTVEFAGFCGELRVGWHFCAKRDPEAKGCVERLQDFMERSFESGRCFANELDFQLQLDGWFDERANPRMHKTLRCRPIDRLHEERAVMGVLPASRLRSTAAGRCGCHRTRICGSIRATTRWTRCWSAARSKSGSASAK